MMKNRFLLAALALVAVHARALTDQQIENMGAQCDQVMDEGLCRVALDAKDYPNPTMLIVNASGSVRISTASYLRVRGANQAKTADGRWLMCSRVRDACKAANGGEAGDDCKVARSLFSTAPPALRAPMSQPPQTIRP